MPLNIVFLKPQNFCLDLSGLVAGDSAICGRLAALILRLRSAGLRFEEFGSPVKRGRVGLAILQSQRGWGRLRFESAATSQNFVPTRELVCDFGGGLKLRVTLRPKSLAICGRRWKATKVSTKTPLLKHYYRRQGLSQFFLGGGGGVNWQKWCHQKSTAFSLPLLGRQNDACA